MKISLFYHLFVLIACLAGMRCANQLAGSASETDTAMIYNPDNTPAIGATVRFFAAGDSSRTLVYHTTTDNGGRFSVKGLAKGVYNMLASKDTLVAFQDSILAFPDTVLINSDTLEKKGSVTGVVGLQPDHDPRTATVQVLGTDIYSNVDKYGFFTLFSMAKGAYDLRLVTTLPDYTPTYVRIHTVGQKKDTLPDTLRILYTGIPVVTGLASAYDTANGIVRLTWDSTTYRNFKEYLVYKDTIGSLQPSSQPIAITTNTYYNDVFQLDGTYAYRVAIRSNTLTVGMTFGQTIVTVYSPQHIKNIFPSDSMAAYLNVPCTLHVHIDPWFGPSPMRSWQVGPKATLLDTSASETPQIVLHDTLTGDYPCILTVSGGAGRVMSDTIHLQTWLAWEKVADPLTDAVDRMLGFKSAVLNGTLFAFLPINATWEEWTSNDGAAWSKIIDSLPFHGWSSNPVAFKNSLFAADDEGLLWTSKDGKVWDSSRVCFPPRDTTSSGSIIYPVGSLWGDENILWYFQNQGPSLNAYDSCFSTGDGKTWLSAGAFFGNGNLGYNDARYNERLVIMGSYWMLRGNFLDTDLVMNVGLSPLSLQPVNFNIPYASANSVRFAVNYNDCIVLFESPNNTIWCSCDLGTTWFKADNNYIGLGDNDEITLLTCFVSNNHIYSISNRGVWRTK
jgi:hypothetical protein